MKQLIPAKIVPWLTLIFGLAGLVLRKALYTLCVDGRGLLIRDNPYDPASWILTALVALLLLVALRPLGGLKSYAYNFWPSTLAALGTILAAAGILVTVLAPSLYPQDKLTLAWRITGYLSAAGLLAAGVCRWLGKKPFFLLYAVVCVFFALHLANQYRDWSGNPQTPDYSFQLLACIFIMLFAYYQTAFTVGSGSRRAQLFTGLMGVFLCCLAVIRTDTPWLYPGCALWLLADRCTMTPPTRRHGDREPDGTGQTEEVA